MPVLSGPSAGRVKHQGEVHSALAGPQWPRSPSLLAAQTSRQTVDTRKRIKKNRQLLSYHLSDTLGWTRGCSIPGQRPPCPLPLTTRELLHVIASWQAGSGLGLVGYMSQTMCKHYPARGKCLNYEAGMRRVTDGNAQRKGQESVGSGREVVGCWFPFKLIYFGRHSGYPGLVQSINICWNLILVHVYSSLQRYFIKCE